MAQARGTGVVARLCRAYGHLVTVALALVLSVALAPPAAAQTFTFTSIRVEGTQGVEPATVASFAGIQQGETLTAGQVNDAYQRVLASGLFESVEFVPQGNTLVIRVVERPLIRTVAIEGNRRLDDEQLLAAIESQPRRVLSSAQAQRDAAAIVALYEQRGRLAATVRPVTIQRGDNLVDLVFEVSEGRVVEIERISFVGNTAFSDARLRRVLSTKQAGIFRALVQRDTLVDARLDFDQQLLRDFYLSRGYPDFRVVDVTSELARDRSATFITFTVQEGQRFSFGRFSATSTIEGLDAESYLARARLRPGSTFSPSVIDAAIRRMEQFALQEGRDFVRIEPVITRDARTATLDVEFRITRGPRIFVERIDIEGNQTTLDRVIRTQFRVAEGDPFNPREIRNAAERIRALGYFEDVGVETRQGTTPEQVIVDVDVVEQPTGSFGFGGSYSIDRGLGLVITFQERNFLGRGQTLSFEFDTTSDTASGTLNFVEPAFLGRDLAFGLNLSYVTSDNDNSEFSTQDVGIRPSLTFPLGDATRLQLRYDLSSEEIFDVSTDSSPILQAEVGTLISSAVGYTLTYDSRRLGYEESTNYLLSFGQDFAGLGGDNRYIRTTARAVAQTAVLNEELTLRATVEGGALNMLDDDPSRLTDRFFTSSRQLRGFRFRGLGPRDLGAVNRDAIGGNYFAVARFEADFPLGLPEEYGITGGLFLDVGSVWGLDNTAGAGGPVDDSAYLRSAVGFSLFWTTPVGPLTFNFSHVLQSEEYDREQDFDFTITTRF
jgi:outer membrane protein insertion porin family